ncbi:MAG: hypothetical protein LAT67_00395 [Balneolales bacterium]|nr:hypothetical protein [Balneolales bacterium]
MFSAPKSAEAQVDWYAGFDLTSQYVWRGIQFDDGVNIQPYLMMNYGGLELGAMASKSTKNPFNEISFWAQYTHSFSGFDLSLYAGDFYYEDGSGNFFNFRPAKDGMVRGAHYIETYAKISLQSVPLSVLYSAIVWNDPDTSMYAEVSYYQSFSDDVTGTFSLGFALNESETWYFTRKAGLVNASFGLTRNVAVTDQFSFPINAKAVLNPYAEAFYVVLKVGF